MLSLATISAGLLLPTFTFAIGPTNIFIDTLSAYSSLAPCARTRMSAIVRAQSSGCGDQQQTTSFACFCYSSSADFNMIISNAVETQCATSSPLAQVSSALDVFSEYCAQGNQLATTVVTMVTSSPTPGATASSTGPTGTSSPTASENSDSLSGGAIAGIVIGVLVGVAAVVVVAFFLWRRRKQGGSKASALPPAEMPTAVDPREMESKNNVKKAPVEVGDGAPEGRAELPAPT